MYQLSGGAELKVSRPLSSSPSGDGLFQVRQHSDLIEDVSHIHQLQGVAYMKARIANDAGVACNRVISAKYLCIVCRQKSVLCSMYSVGNPSIF